MTDQPSQLALRDLRDEMSSRNRLAVLIGIGVLLGLSGPFDTLAILGLVPRITYWIAIVLSTYAAGAFVDSYVRVRWHRHLVNQIVRILLIGFATGCAVIVVLTAITFLTFGWIHDTIGEVFANFGIICLICIIIVALLDIVHTAATDVPQTTAAILDRLPFDKRGRLISISVRDHYVDVVTHKGNELLLLRLSDAIREVGPVVGLQVHRSHWIAKSEVSAATRKGDRAILTMSNGSEIPASRAYIPALRDAGLLVRGTNG